MDLAPGGSTVTITLTPDEGDTSLRLLHEGLTPEQAVSHAEGWKHYLARLVAETFAASGAGPAEWPAAPDPIDYFSSANASLAVLLGARRKLIPDDREKPTPCESFNTHELLEHLSRFAETHRRCAWCRSARRSRRGARSAHCRTHPVVEGLAKLTISDQIRASGSFASIQPVAETAGSLERLIAFT